MRFTVIFLIVLASSLSLSAQIEKGTFMLEGGIKLSGDGLSYANPFTETSGISFSSNEYYGKDVFTGKEKSWFLYHEITYSLAPRLGYFLFRNFVIGTDLKYYKKAITYEIANDKDKYRTALYGIFIRQYLGKGKITPLAEAGAGFGLTKSVTNEISPGGGHYTMTIPRNLYYISGAAGASFQVNTKFRINLLAKIQKTIEKPITTENYSTGETRTLNLDSGFILSFSYFFNRKAKIVKI